MQSYNKEGNRTANFKADIWKLRGIRRGCEKGICPLYLKMMLNTYHQVAKKVE